MRPESRHFFANDPRPWCLRVCIRQEFDTAEAAESLGSWRLYFVTLTEQRAFLAAHLDTYRQRCKVGLAAGWDSQVPFTSVAC